MAENNTSNDKLKDPNGPKGKYINKEIRVGAFHVHSIMKMPLLVDAHMHIQSGRCAPLPFIWHNIDFRPTSTNYLFQEALPPRSSLENIEKFLQAKINKAADRYVETSANNDPMGMGTGTVDFSGFGCNALYAASKTEMVKGVLRLNKISKEPSNEIADKFMEMQQIPVCNELSARAEYEGMNLLLVSMVMTMDMEYAHLYGYYGIKIYNGVYKEGDTLREKPIHYWYPQYLDETWNKNKDGSYFRKENATRQETQTDGLSEKGYDQFQDKLTKDKGIFKTYYDEDDRPAGSVKVKIVPAMAPDEETKLYEAWDKQLFLTKLAVMKHPLKLLPLYHFDPRRYLDGYMTEAFKAVGEEGLFAGFKMYTAQGYRPLDRRLPALKDFYEKCAADGIPIMNHCTPKGAPTFDRENYYHFRHPLDTAADEKEKQDEKIFFNGDAKSYFNRRFVSPGAWTPVLETYPKLWLCLAHFGGDTQLGELWLNDIIGMMYKKGDWHENRYLNLYADISSAFAGAYFREQFKKKIQKNPHIADRILFGTDWYLSVQDIPYASYIKTAKSFLDSFDTSLWPKFTIYNPYRFYHLDKVAERLAKNIEKERKKKEIYEKIDRFDPVLCAHMYKVAAYIKSLKQIYPECS